jgi:hypothetical protein
VPETNDTNPTMHELREGESLRSHSDRPDVPTIEPPTTTTTVIEELPPRRRWPWRLAVATAVAAGVVALYEVFLPRVVPVAAPHLFSEGEPGAVRPVPTAPSDSVAMRLSATPANARLFFDGRELGTNPFIGSVERSDSEHRVRVEAPGHEPFEQLVVARRAVNLELHLRPLPSAATARDARPGARRR